MIDATSTAPATPTAPATAGSTNVDPIGRDAFLKLLVTQLQHQDPTRPQDSDAFLAQLAQFSSLEQLQQMNQTLGTIAAFFATIQGDGGLPDAAATPTEGKV